MVDHFIFVAQRICTNKWKLEEAERMLSARWADPTLFCEQMKFCEKATFY